MNGPQFLFLARLLMGIKRQKNINTFCIYDWNNLEYI
jgi:hypothetical protein